MNVYVDQNGNVYLTAFSMPGNTYGEAGAYQMGQTTICLNDLFRRIVREELAARDAASQRSQEGE